MIASHLRGGHNSRQAAQMIFRRCQSSGCRSTIKQVRMFFTPERLDFFKPLTGKYRESIAQCLCLLYERLYSSNADYGHALSRDQLLEILEEALARVPKTDMDEDDSDSPQRFKSLREKAGWVMKQLLDSGWLENRSIQPPCSQPIRSAV